MTSEAPLQDARFELRGGGAVELFASGFSHPGDAGRRFTPYLELIHVTLAARGVRIAAERGSYWVARAAFHEPGAAAALAAALQERVAALPDAAARLAHQQALDLRQAAPARPRLGLALVLVCVVLHVLTVLQPTLCSTASTTGAGLHCCASPGASSRPSCCTPTSRTSR